MHISVLVTSVINMVIVWPITSTVIIPLFHRGNLYRISLYPTCTMIVTGSQMMSLPTPLCLCPFTSFFFPLRKSSLLHMTKVRAKNRAWSIKASATTCECVIFRKGAHFGDVFLEIQLFPESCSHINQWLSLEAEVKYSVMIHSKSHGIGGRTLSPKIWAV